MTDSCQTEEEKKVEDPSSQNDICPLCHGVGWKITFGRDSQPYAEECECGIRKREIHNSRLKFAEIPEAFKEVRLSNFKKTIYKKPESQEMVVEAAMAIRYWLQNLSDMKKRGIGLYIYSGIKGSGKTRLIASIANELVEKYDTQVKFCTSIQILQEIKETWGKKRDYEQETEKKLIDTLSGIEVLIIDDFGAEQGREWKDERFYSIINGRYVDKKITLFTSNMRLDDLGYDERIKNRIKERVLQIPFPEESVRDTLAENLKKELIEGMMRNGK